MNPYVEPVMDGWIRDQRENQGKDIQFWHLDSWINWIVEHGLTRELKKALEEAGVPIRGAD